MEQTYLSFSCCGFSLNLRGGFSSWSSVGRPHTLTAGCGSEINVIVNTIFSVINFKPVIIFNASSVTGDTSSSLHPVCFRRTRWNSNPVKFIGYWILAWTLTFKSNPNIICKIIQSQRTRLLSWNMGWLLPLLIHAGRHPSRGYGHGSWSPCTSRSRAEANSTPTRHSTAGPGSCGVFTGDAWVEGRVSWLKHHS